MRPFLLAAGLMCVVIGVSARSVAAQDSSGIKSRSFYTLAFPHMTGLSPALNSSSEKFFGKFLCAQSGIEGAGAHSFAISAGLCMNSYTRQGESFFNAVLEGAAVKTVAAGSILRIQGLFGVGVAPGLAFTGDGTPSRFRTNVFLHPSARLLARVGGRFQIGVEASYVFGTEVRERRLGLILKRAR